MEIVGLLFVLLLLFIHTAKFDLSNNNHQFLTYEGYKVPFLFVKFDIFELTKRLWLIIQIQKSNINVWKI